MVAGVSDGYAMSRNASLATGTAISLQFYEAVAPLANELGRAMAVALDQGHAALLVVTDATRQMLEEQLVRRGIDVDASRRRGQYVYLDGLRTLEKCTVGGMPEPARFQELVERPVERLVREYSRVWMYGELAAILWTQGHERGALEVDQLWAACADAQPVVLCAAFPVEALSWPVVADALQESVADQVRAMANGSPIALAVHTGPKGDS
jgi:MEDS: MEthanogen/methylotroph, DcmR Sensory domain